jgi:histone H3/H4
MLAARRRVDLLVCQGQLLLEVQAHRLVILLAVAERANKLSINLKSKTIKLEVVLNCFKLMGFSK